MCEWNIGGLSVPLPDDICPGKENRTVCIDECIIATIKALWAAGVQTLGCCCGHGKERASIVLADTGNLDDIVKTERILSEDGRAWSIIQWRPIEIWSVRKEEKDEKSGVVESES